MPFTPDPLPWAGTPGFRVSLPTAARLGKMEAGLGDTSMLGERNLLAVGDEVVTRTDATSSTQAMTSQGLRLTFFTARKTQMSTQVRLVSGTTAAAATPTLFRVGLYLVNETTGSRTLVASTVNDTGLFSVASTAYTRPWSAPYAVTMGQRYAMGVLIVTAVATPTIVGQILSSALSADIVAVPRLTGLLTGQADLPESFTDASLAETGIRYYGVILP